MAPSLTWKSALLTGLALAPLAQAVKNQRLNYVFSSVQFNTVDPPAKRGLESRESAYAIGFSIIDTDGNQVWHSDDPGNHSPCYNTDGGRTFTISDGCFSASYQFHCEADFAGRPETCSVLDSTGATLSTGHSDDSTDFAGFAIGTEGYCGGSWVLESEYDRCDPDSTGFTVS